jgi:hypothetical protein
MMSQFEIEAELVRLAQCRTKTTGSLLRDELSRMVVEEAIVRLNPELGWLVESDQNLSDSDRLVSALKVNDIVVNGLRIDVRSIDANGEVTIDRSLIGTSYLNHGSLVVEMTTQHSGKIAGYITAATWMSADRQAQDSTHAKVKSASLSPVDLPELLKEVANQPPSGKARSASEPDLVELNKFVSNRQQISLPRQRQIVESLLGESRLRQKLEQVAGLWSDGTLSRILSAESVWNNRIETMTDKIAAKFKRLNRDQIRRQLMRTGEQFGGQPESPQFKKALLSTLAREEVLSRFQGIDLAKVGQAVDRVLSGRPVVDAVKDLVKNKHTVDLAIAIKNKRQNLQDFMTATADEIGMAFGQLALKPAYATHSAENESGVDSVNEALAMLQAGELAEELTKLADTL